MEIPVNDPDSKADSLMDSLLQEIAKFDHLQEERQAEAAEAAAKPEPLPVESRGPAFLHVREPARELNPIFAKGVQYAQFDAGQDLNALIPDHLAEIPVLEKGAVVAVRDSKRKMDLVPGENLASKMMQGRELYLAKARGRLVVIGNDLHLLPSDRDGGISIRISADNLSAFIDLSPAYGSGRFPNWESIDALLKKMKITFGIQEHALREALQKCRGQSCRVEKILAAQGTEVVPGKDGNIEYFFDRDYQGPVNLTLDKEGNVDYHNVQWIPIVKKEQLLARVTPTIPAKDGVDIFGNIRKAQQPPKVYLVAGKNVLTDEQECEFRAEANGCVQLNGTILEVMNVFVVNSDVDFHTGNVKFTGNVLVTGSVNKGFSVEAEGDIVVMKNVEPSQIKAGRDVLVKGGLLGGGKGEFRIEAGRHVTLGYAENAWVEAQGDIKIENFAMQSFLYSCGHITAEGIRGSIIGGETMAAKGIDAKSIGSEAGVKTNVAAGVNFVIKRQMTQLSKQKADVLQAMEKVDHFLKGMLELAGQGALAPSKAESLKGVIEKRKAMSKVLGALSARLQELEGQLNEKTSVMVRVRETAHTEVNLSLHGKSLKIAQPYYRSVFYFNEKTEQIIRRQA